MKRLLLSLLLGICVLSVYSGISMTEYNSSRLIFLGKHLGQDLYAIREGVNRFGDNSVYVLINGKLDYSLYSYRSVDLLQEGLNYLIDCSENGIYYSTSDKDYLIYKGIIDNDTCLIHKDYVIAISNDSVAYWERSSDNGISWERIENSHLIYTVNVEEESTVLYRNVSIEGNISPIITVRYIDAVPENVKTCIDNTVKTVDESVTFTLDVSDHDYTYQWYKDGMPIAGATESQYSIEAVKAADAGSYTCQVSNECSESTSVAATLTVNKCPQVINFSEFEPVTYGCDPIELPATTDKGLVITYQSTNSSVASIVGHVVTVVGVGEANIVASQAGNEDYLAATPVTRTLHVNKITQSIVFEAIPRKTYGDLPFELPETTDKGLPVEYRVINTEVATVSEHTITIVGAGSTDIVASQAGDGLHYEAIPVTQTLIVDKAEQTITLLPFEEYKYGDADILLNEVTDKGLPITYVSQDATVASVTENKVHIVGVGSTGITAMQDGNHNYLPAKSVTQILTVAKGEQKIILGNIPNKVYGDEDFELPAVTDKGLAVTYSSSDTAVATVHENVVHIEGVGTCQITAVQPGDGYYAAAKDVTLPFSVSKAYQEITFAPLGECTFGMGNLMLLAECNSGSEVYFVSSDTTVVRVEGHEAVIVGAGVCTITAYAESNPNCYDATPVRQELRVLKAAQSLTLVSPEPKTYGDVPFKLEATGTSGLDVVFSSSDAGILFIDGDTAHITGAGDVTITATQLGNDDYLPVSSSVVLHIAKAQLMLKPEVVKRFYGDDNPEIFIVYSGFVNGDSEYDFASLPSVETDAVKTSPVGTYDTSIRFVTDSKYEISTQRGELIIEPAPLTVSVDDAIKTYGEVNPVFTFSYEGLKLGQTAGQALIEQPSAITSVRTASPVGTYSIEVSGAVSSNYSIDYKPGTLTVEKAPLKISLRDETVSYGDEPKYKFYYEGWKLDDDESDLDYLPQVVTKATVLSYPGEYALSLSGGLDDNYYYVLSDKACYLIIEKALLDVYAPEVTKSYGSPNPEFTLLYEGFKNGDTEADLERRPMVYCSADEQSWYGEYVISLDGGYDSRYTFRLHDGLLTVLPSASSVDNVQVDDNFMIVGHKGYILLKSKVDGWSVDVFNMSGYSVASRRDVGVGETVIAIEDPGVYILRINCNGKVRIQKVLIE